MSAAPVLDPQSAIRHLSQHACLELLRAEAIGRVGFVSRQGVEILPIGYRLADGPRLLMMTRPRGILGQLAEIGARCSFEVDHHDNTGRAGWSVLMQGVLTRLDGPGTAAYGGLTRSLDSWPGYPDATPIQFVPDSYSGRSVLRPS